MSESSPALSIPGSRPRPLSPHISVYRKQLTSVLSIFHRITGVVLSAGALGLVTWLWAAAYSPEWFEQVSRCATGLVGRVVLIGFTLAYFYHLSNGIRHLCWDAGLGFRIPTVYKSGYAVLTSTVGFTALTWYFVLFS